MGQFLTTMVANNGAPLEREDLYRFPIAKGVGATPLIKGPIAAT